jgi:surfeit locus 1 family protein
MLLHKMFHRKWLIPTLLVLLGTALCIRLGIWQLDRLEARRAFNEQVESMRALPPLNLHQDVSNAFQDMEWRAVRVSGRYDFENQIAIRNQYNGGQYGYHLLTPLLFDGKALLVDRGWIPADGNSVAQDWRKYDEVGEVNLSGQVRLGHGKPAIGGVADVLPENGARLEIWNNADVTRIAGQLPYHILPVYIQLDSDTQDTEPPIPFQPEVELTEGPHFGYALQWFTFATILFVGYPFFLRKQETVAT